ncbi:hypothetical protein [Deinococcus sp. Marseille-Q6407]|uniref:hypothetical protein n=1 Tax=Deinococcus sp. Marseille-Q6407 TaxID=2969223 RepID=UPI0021C0B53C|nr:hypothetical protein [Deinococcus sp. Marseille-Q6407]
MDTRPFLTLTTPSGARLKCKQPRVLPLSMGVSDGAGTVAADNATHTIGVYMLGKADTSELVDGGLIWVDVEKRQRPQPFRIMRNGISRGAGLWKLYVRADDGAGLQPPAAPGAPVVPMPDDGYEP